MAISTRLYFKADKKQVIEKEISFTFYAGFAPSQKIKNRISMHEAILKQEPKAKILEVSTKSDIELGKTLSAFNLKLNNRPFECVFQEAKRFKINSVKTQFFTDKKECLDISDRLIEENGVYYIEPQSDNPRELKSILKDFMKANKDAKISHFYYKDEIFEVDGGVKNSSSFFYDFLYFSALRDNFSQNELEQILEFNIFTDIEFNHKKSINCQARTCALYHYALLNNKVEFYMQSKENFKLLYADMININNSLC